MPEDNKDDDQVPPERARPPAIPESSAILEAAESLKLGGQKVKLITPKG